MKDFNKTYNEELFPELSSYNRAVNYPYFAPDYPFSFYKGRFIKDICNVVEFGLVGKTMHQTDEAISVEDLESLTLIYYDIIKKYQEAHSEC